MLHALYHGLRTVNIPNFFRSDDLHCTKRCKNVKHTKKRRKKTAPGTRYSYCTYNCSRYYTSTGYEYWYEYVLRDTSRIQYRPANKETPIWSEPQIIICCSRPGHFLISRFLSTEGIETCFSYVYGFFLFMPDIRKG